MFKPEDAMRRSLAIPHPTKPGHFTYPHPDGDGTVLSVQPDHSIAKRPKGTHGPWETFRDDGNAACFDEVIPGMTIAILLKN